MRSQIVWCGFLMLVAPFANACDMRYYELEIPIEVQFENEQFRHDWVYRSLQPDLDTPGAYANGPTAARVENGSLHVTFCVDGTFDEKSNMTLKMASGAIKLVPRPIEWRMEGERRVGRMTAVRLLDRPDPNWVVIRSVRVLPEVDGSAALLEVTVVNFGSFESSHDQLVVRGTERSYHVACAEDHIRYQDTVLNLSQSSESSNDGKSWTALADRKVDVQVTVISRCGPDTFRAEIPIQARVPPQQTTRIVLRILDWVPVAPNEELKPRALRHREEHPSQWWRRWYDIEAGIKSSPAYPTLVSLQGEGSSSDPLPPKPGDRESVLKRLFRESDRAREPKDQASPP